MKNTGIHTTLWAATPAGYSLQKGLADSITLARQHERAMIGHELHDNVNQILTCAHLYLSVLKRDCAEFETLIGKTMDIVQLGIEEIRKLAAGMVTDDLRGEGLIGSMSSLVEQVRGAASFGIRFGHSQPECVERLDSCKKITLYRILQEQIKNIIKHSQAGTVDVALYCSDGQVRLEIGDDGVGFDLSRTRKGLGLSNIYERIAMYGGKVRLDTAPGQGCRLIVDMPVSYL